MVYVNHTGGAKGADAYWKEHGEQYGVKTIDWRPKDLRALKAEAHADMLKAFESAAKSLKRPSIFMGMELAQRNWIPVNIAKAIYAVGYITPPGIEDWGGYRNITGKEVVAGGTGWGVEMAIQMGKPVWVFNMSDNFWYEWYYGSDIFIPSTVPTLTETFAGIGSRFLTPEGIQAIKNVYEKTFTCTT